MRHGTISRPLPVAAALLMALLTALFTGACAGDDGGPEPTVLPGPEKSFGDPGATVSITEYFDYR